MSKLRLTPRYALPLMMGVAVLMVGVRLGDIWQTVAEGKIFPPVTQARAADQAAPAPAAKPETAAAPEAKAAETPAPDATTAGSSVSSSSGDDSTPEGDLYKQLLGRREQLDKRAQELDAREALIKVAETRVDQKLKEMETLRGQLQSLVGQANAAQQEQLDNLVKIYEIMKPKEAAKIFETLDMPILLGVVQKMKPARTAAVMAEMNPEKAKEVTTALTKRDQLPTGKEAAGK